MIRKLLWSKTLNISYNTLVFKLFNLSVCHYKNGKSPYLLLKHNNWHGNTCIILPVPMNPIHNFAHNRKRYIMVTLKYHVRFGAQFQLCFQEIENKCIRHYQTLHFIFKKCIKQMSNTNTMYLGSICAWCFLFKDFPAKSLLNERNIVDPFSKMAYKDVPP